METEHHESEATRLKELPALTRLID
eukprot:SAG11_NODE_32359_length_284_cov_0.837838_1_plen_24_part_10